ncbi:MAG: type II secretion system F family protein [Oscillospiraceae bacterium]|nr:type II secretion system F family protein [Oscillospiraceae bacterium]
MPQYSYVATDVNGNISRGKEIADDHYALIEKLKTKQLFLTSYKEMSEKARDVTFKYKTKQLAFLCRQLSSMLVAGISIVRALHIMVSQETNKKAKALLTEIYEQVQTGRSLSEALASKPGSFPNLFLSMVAAGEASGNLDMIMVRVADHYAKENKTNNKIRSAMIYPIILAVLMVAVVLGLFTFIFPMFMDMIGDDTSDIPMLSIVLMNISNFMTTYWYILLIGAAVLAIVGRVLLKTPSVRFKFDQGILNLPKAGDLICTIYTARFARTMSNLFASGLQMVECIEKSAQTLGNIYVSERFKEVVENVKRGEPLSAALIKIDIFHPIFTAMVVIGEESGSLDNILSKTADYYDEEADSAISSLVSMLEPIMIICLGGAVGLVLAGIFPLIYGTIGSLGNE